tara:strand:- start:1689 stop:1814 length:126 start_codon:yes stop_codon:yes gene_type:complete
MIHEDNEAALRMRVSEEGTQEKHHFGVGWYIMSEQRAGGRR